MRVALYVGSFDPPHIGHLNIANYIIENNYSDLVFFVPTSSYWDKKLIVPLEDRVNMLKAFEGTSIRVKEEYCNYQYTYQIMEKLKEKDKNMELYLVIGADNLENFDKWQSINEILENKILVINRDSIDAYKYINKFKNKESFILINDISFDISSTDIRKKIKERISLDNLVTKDVLKYIEKHDLYKEE